nr:retrovirus-related Pol polyprotein from transposon TNT 1-94 [Tanacetum cinerariifolium]
RRDDDQIYKFKEGDFKRLRLQDIEDMLLLLRHVEDLQLGVESYQKKLNLTKPDTYRTDLRRREVYTAYSNPRGFIYQNKDKKNRLMRIDELHKFSDGTLNDVRNALDDRLKGIRMQYLPSTIWRKGDKDRAAAIFQAIKKMLKTRRIMRSLEKFLGGRLLFRSVYGTVRFENDHVAAILGFGDLQWGNILITRVYFVEGLGHNLFSSWLWHQRLSRLKFDTINDLAKNDLVAGLPKFKYYKEHLCPSCEQGKSKRASHPPKPVPNSRQRLHLLHMDLCGPMRTADDYSRYTWVHFLRSKDEAPKVIIKFLKRITVLLQSSVIIIRTDNDTEFKNQVLKVYFDSVGISHQMSSVRTPQQNRVVE